MERSGGKGREEEEQDGMSVHSPCKPPPSSASSLPKEQSQVELELRLFEALEIYPPGKLQGRLSLINAHISPYSLSCCFHSFDRHFSADEVLQLLERFYNLEMLKPDDEEMDFLNREEEFCLPQNFFVKEEP
ncbi:hypothetical protein DVH24_040620 [Malus domestica]|uniref:Chromatin modification-related protein EAF7 n=1 Tax=Malus domestica TaxID=3750 RepID=A0A498IE62_MALDO|nr:hypothetical protein DVH24_040620 [Malus domestica]